MASVKQKKIIWILIGLLFSICPNVYGSADLTSILERNFDVQPLDIASSEDGNMIFLLARGKLILYSSKQDAIISRAVIDTSYDRMTYSGKNKTLILASSSSGALKIIHVEQIHEISLSGLPFKGPLDARVTIAVFDDYQ